MLKMKPMISVMKKMFLCVAFVAVLSSCSYKRLTYLQDMDTLTTYDVTEGPEAVIRKNDKVKILVSCTNPTLSAPFNLGGVEAAVDAVTGQISAPKTGLTAPEYLVDKNGDILFPILGSIHVEGLTMEKLREEVTRQIVERNLIKDPIVTVEFSNFQITVLGEVASRGNYLVNGNTTILEAIAQCGDLTTSAMINDVWVIRTDGKRRIVYSLDLRSKSCYDSPGFYLQQNDVVYVKPRKSKLDANAQLGLQISGMALSVVSIIANALIWTLGRNK